MEIFWYCIRFIIFSLEPKKCITYYTISFLILRIAKLKGITSDRPPDPDAEKTKKSKRKSKDCENIDDGKYIDYKGMLRSYHDIFLFCSMVIVDMVKQRSDIL